jgi:iron(III) transport system ATP-binding protein
MTTMLDVRGLAKSFNGHTVLDHIDLQVMEGSIAAVVGSSGCGKTTLLRLVAGFETPDAGTVTISGRAVAGADHSVAPHRRRVGYVAQDGALFPHLTVGQNIAYGLTGSSHSRAVRGRVTELLETVSLDGSYASRRPHELSGGQQQRVALARALARKPVLMLLDEPFSALDTGLRASTRKAVARLLADAGVTTLLVTHDQEEALSIADQIAVMRDGRFTQVGAPQEVYRRPNDRFTAEFLGDCISLPCTVASGIADCALGRVPVQSSVEDGPATLALRPEQLVATLVSDSAARVRSTESDIPDGVGTVIGIEFLGHDVLLTIDPACDVAPIIVRQNSLDPPPIDAKVRIEVLGNGVALK